MERTFFLASIAFPPMSCILHYNIIIIVCIYSVYYMQLYTGAVHQKWKGGGGGGGSLLT